MKTPTTTKLGFTLAGVLALTLTAARADSFGSGANAFNIDFVTIGNPGNPLDTGTTGLYSTPYGAVGYTYQMGTYEISEDMIDKANTVGGLFITKTTRSANQAATAVSWNEAAQFVNWLNVSSGSAPAYKFAVNPGDAGYVSNTEANANLVLWAPGDAGYDAGNLYRNRNARYVLPSEDEWYKAAYYSGSGSLYYDYATGSDTIPTAVVSGTGAGTAVYSGGGATAPADITQAGGLSYYGTMGQNGNVFEWDESAFAAPNDDPSENRAIRGGLWGSTEINLRASIRISNSPTNSSNTVGFRVASVPEPTSWAMLAAGAASLLARRRRSRQAAIGSTR